MNTGSKAITENTIIKRGKSRATSFDPSDNPTCRRFFILWEPYFYIRVSSAIEDPLLLYPTECGINTCSSDYYISNYDQNSFLLCYLQQGSLVLNIPTGTHHLQSGDCYFIDTSRPHIYYNDSNLNNTMIFLHIGGNEVGKYYDYITKRSGTNIFHPDDSFVNDFRHFIIQFSTNNISDPLLVSSGIVNLLAKLDSKKDESSEHMNLVLSYIQNHYHEQISLDTLCSISNFSKSSLINRFKASFGYTPHQYILNTRLAMAYHKLNSSDINIDELAYSVGFNSSTAFIEAFKKKYNTTPRKLRATSKETIESLQ